MHSVTIDAEGLERLGKVRDVINARKMADELGGRIVLPAEGATVAFSTDVEALAIALIDEWPASFDHLRQWRLLYVLDAKPPKRGCKAIARALLAPPLWHDLYGPDAVVAVSATFWGGADRRGRDGAVYHALSHLWTAEDETGEAAGLRIADHDVEAFLGEVTKYGDWRKEIGALAEQMSIWSDGRARS